MQTPLDYINRMKCVVLNCPNSSVKNPDKVSFHGFPTDAEVLSTWVTFTGRPNFIPNFSSKICSTHFEHYAYHMKTKKLKSKAVPTIHAIIGGDSPCYVLSSENSQNSRSKSDPLACILNPNTAINNVELIRASANETVTSFHPSVSQSLMITQPNKISSINSSNHFFQSSLPSPNDTIILNYNRDTWGTARNACYVPMQINVPVDFLHMQGVHLINPEMSTSLAVSSTASIQQPNNVLKNNIQSLKGPIKVVDMKKLLQTPPEDDVDSKNLSKRHDSTKKIDQTKDKGHSKLLEKCSNVPQVGKSNKVDHEKLAANKLIPDPSLKVTISQILDCLKLILPMTFDLSRLIPNEKVATLVIRYSKLTDCTEIRNTINLYLKVIVDAAKTKERVFGNDTKHPYLKINDTALQLALEKVLPSNFSMVDLSNQVLNCLCIVLNQEIFPDGYHILRRKIRNFTSEGQKFCEILSEASGAASLSQENKIHEGSEKPSKLLFVTNNVQSEEKGQQNVKEIFTTAKTISDPLVSVNNNKTVKSSSSLKVVQNKTKYAERLKKFKSKVMDTKPPDEENSYSKTKIDYGLSSDDSEYSKNESDVSDYETEHITKSKDKPKFSANKNAPKGPGNLREILRYLEVHHCSARSVLGNFRLMFYLCRFLHIKSSQYNLQKLKESLHLISKKNINKDNIKEMEQKRYAKQKTSPLKATQKDNHSKSPFPIKKKDKLRLNPIVVLHNLVDYCTDDLLYMRNERKLNKNNGYYNQRVPFCFQQNVSAQKYSSDYVKKITSESYKQFRKISTKTDGNKVVFRLKFTRLIPGSSVFVKDFRNPLEGWFKGTVKKVEGPLNYLVQLSNGEMCRFAAEQIRPILFSQDVKPDSNLNPRVPRVVKPKQLFDL